MKRKIFTLLLAIGVLTAFQANALQRQKIHIKADTSVWDAGGVAVGNSFPFQPDNLGNSDRWLSFDSDGNLFVGADTILLEYDFYKTDSTNFKFFRPGAKASSPLVLKESENPDVKSFAIIKFTDLWNGTNEKKFGEIELVTDTTGTKEGYLVSVPAGSSSLRVDSIKDFSLVGAKNGTLSFKKFNKFAFYGDSVPYAPFWGYQYGGKFDPGKLYQSSSFPYFQIYDTARANHNSDTTFISADTPSNWGDIAGRKNLNDSLVYSWLDIKLFKDSALVLLGDTIRLDSIKQFADTLTTKTKWNHPDVAWETGRTWKGIDTTSFDSLKSIPPITSDSVRVYLRSEGDNQLSFTVRRDSSSDYVDTDWTNGEPTKFPFAGADKDSCYIYIDTMFFDILPNIILEYVSRDSSKNNWRYGAVDSLFSPEKNHLARYLYKENDDSWHPLYVKLEKEAASGGTMKKDTATYVGWEWVKKNHYHLSAAVQTIVGNSGLAVVNNEDTISLGSTTNAARFKFEQADSILADRGFAKYENKKKPGFQNSGTIELFRISNGSKYLTVLDTTEFTDVRSDTATVDNIQLGWILDQYLSDSARARQMFAIVHRYADSSVAFLPVASRKWTLKGESVEYEDSLSFNLGIGRKLPASSDTVDFAETWYLTKKAQLDNNNYKLVIADSASKTERIWFDLKSTLVNGIESGTYVSIKKDDKYYRVDGSFVDSTSNNDIKAHWKIDKVSNVAGKSVKSAWKFTPVVNDIYGSSDHLNKHFAGKPVFALKENEDDDILLVDSTNEKVLDTVRVDNINPTQFSLFKNLDGITDTTVIIVSGNKYITLGALVGNDTIVAVAADTTENPVKVTPSNVKCLVDTLYPIHHYTFSIEKEDGKKYFLNAGDSIVRWVLLGATEAATLSSSSYTNKAYASYKFALPNFENDGLYLQTLDTGKMAGPYVINFVDNKLKVVNVQDSAKAGSPEGIYSAIDFYNKGKSGISMWEIKPKEFKADGPGKETWLSRNDLDLDFEVGAVMEKGVFSANSKYISYITDESGVHYGILQATPDTLTLKYKENVGTVETFNIVSVIDGLWLSVEDGKAIFTDTADMTQASAFAFCKEAGENGFAIVPADDINESNRRFLSVSVSTVRDSLIFTTEGDGKLDFTWGECEVTGIKAITASGKIYGVAGGVKVLGATGAVAIYTIDGRLVTKKTVSSPNQTIAVPAGIYIVRNGAEATKVVVK